MINKSFSLEIFFRTDEAITQFADYADSFNVVFPYFESTCMTVSTSSLIFVRCIESMIYLQSIIARRISSPPPTS